MNIRIYSNKKHTTKIRTNICIGKYLNIFEYSSHPVSDVHSIGVSGPSQCSLILIFQGALTSLADVSYQPLQTCKLTLFVSLLTSVSPVQLVSVNSLSFLGSLQHVRLFHKDPKVPLFPRPQTSLFIHSLQIQFGSNSNHIFH